MQQFAEVAEQVGVVREQGAGGETAMAGLVAQDRDAGAGSQQVERIHGTADSERGEGRSCLGGVGGGAYLVDGDRSVAAPCGGGVRVLGCWDESSLVSACGD